MARCARWFRLYSRARPTCQKLGPRTCSPAHCAGARRWSCCRTCRHPECSEGVFQPENALTSEAPNNFPRRALPWIFIFSFFFSRWARLRKGCRENRQDPKGLFCDCFDRGSSPPPPPSSPPGPSPRCRSSSALQAKTVPGPPCPRTSSPQTDKSPALSQSQRVTRQNNPGASSHSRHQSNPRSCCQHPCPAPRPAPPQLCPATPTVPAARALVVPAI